jgi:hypothetical protein
MFKRSACTAISIIAVWALIERAQATEIESLPSVLKYFLGKVKVQHGKEGDYWYPVGKKANRVVFIEKNVYPPNCTHTWAIGINTKDGKVSSVKPVEMSCPHGLPAKSKTFLSQFEGKSMASIKTLDSIDTIAKATGTCKLAGEAVKKAITEYHKIKGKI